MEILKIGFIFGSLISTIFCYIIWWEKIYKVEILRRNKSKKFENIHFSILELIKEILILVYIRLISYFKIEKTNEEIKNDEIYQKEVRKFFEIFPSFLPILYAVILGLSGYEMEVGRKDIVFIIILALDLSMTYKILKEKSQDNIELLQGLNEFLQKEVYKKEKIKLLVEGINLRDYFNKYKKLKSKKYLSLIIFIPIGFFLLNIESFLLNKNFMKDIIDLKLVIIVYFVYKISFQFWKRLQNNNKKLNEIVIENIDILEQDIKEMCDKVKITKLKVRTVSEDYLNAHVISDKDGNLEIILTEPLILELEDKKDILKTIFAHELVHYKYKDNFYIKWRTKIACFLSLLILMTYMNYFFKIENFASTIILGMILYICSIVSDESYWFQMAELRADRIAIDISGVQPEKYTEYLKDSSFVQNEIKNNNYINKNNFIYREYKKNIEKIKHPSLKRRIEVLDRKYKKWGYLEYFTHIFIITKWKLTGRGWRGIEKEKYI